MYVSGILLYCRPGMENDCAAEVVDRAAAHNIYGYVKSEPNTGYIRFITHDPDQALSLIDDIPFEDWIFPRQCLHVSHELQGLPAHDRVGAIVSAAESWPEVEDVWQEYPDTNEGKQITRLTKKLEKTLHNGLKKQGTLNPRSRSGIRGHLFWLNGTHLFMGLSAVDNSAPWLLGYPRLRFPKQAPSRSTLKLEEAWVQMLSQSEVDKLFKSGFRAVDLGAAPGGWTWQLVQKHLKVFAIDNGPMDDGLMASGRVTHLREDAFTFKPRGPMEWMVCDIVDKPARVMQLMLKWLLNGWCQHTIFNLKLPMKQRYKTVQKLLTELETELTKAGLQYQLKVKQLYHDREEVTVFVSVESGD